jgi:cation diffusion facilitator CzcD-associated flavoprotein CzcO
VARNLDLRFIIIGAGMSGMLAAIKLREAGYRHVTLLEKAGRIGGTWRENHYPGLACDVPAHAYTYSFARNPEWSAYYAPGPEIQAYFEKVAREHGVHEVTNFHQEVTGCTWESGAWQVTTASGECFSADFVIAASGVLHHPRMPDIAGLESFKGRMAHSALWDDSIELAGKRVGVIGTGSTGVQIVSAVARIAASMAHFQRSPQWIMPVQQFSYTEEQKAAFRRDPQLIDAIRYDREYEANVRRFTTGIADPDRPEMKIIEDLCRQNLEQNVRDPLLREKLRPDYRAACKRLIYSPDYYEVVQKHGVDIVREGIECVEPSGVRTRDGRLHELDVIALATGYRADRFIRPAVVRGRGGRLLDDVWATRATAYYAISLPDFPNLFFLNGPTAPVGNFSLIDVAERQWGYIEQLVEQVSAGACEEICASEAAMADYDERRIAAAKRTIFASGCTSWYLDSQGIPVTWPWGYDAFAEAMARPVLADYDQRKSREAA